MRCLEHTKQPASTTRAFYSRSKSTWTESKIEQRKTNGWRWASLPRVLIASCWKKETLGNFSIGGGQMGWKVELVPRRGREEGRGGGKRREGRSWHERPNTADYSDSGRSFRPTSCTLYPMPSLYSCTYALCTRPWFLFIPFCSFFYFFFFMTFASHTFSIFIKKK